MSLIAGRILSCRRQRMSGIQRSRPTASGWPTRRTTPVEKRSTSSRIRGPAPSSRCRLTGENSPAWSGDGTELFYVTSTAGAPIVMNAVPVKATVSGFPAGLPRKLFQGRYLMTRPFRSYDVTPDGQRFLMIQLPDPRPSRPQELVLVENWLDELRRRVPSKP